MSKRFNSLIIILGKINNPFRAAFVMQNFPEAVKSDLDDLLRNQCTTKSVLGAQLVPTLMV